MKEKAEEQLASLRKAEVNAKHNFGMPRQSLGDQLKFEEQKAEPEHDLGKLITKIDMAAFKSATLKEEVKELQSELSGLDTMGVDKEEDGAKVTVLLALFKGNSIPPLV